MKHTRILILGAGLTGLSAAFHLRGEDFALYEKEPEIGGLCRSFQIGRFTFDYTGHLLHFRKPEIREWIVEMMGENLVRHQRKAFIYSHGVYTDYPFQANLNGLPKEVIKECLLGYIQAEIRNSAGGTVSPRNFEEWISATLGPGIASHFMIPFNRKLWKRELDKMNADWVSWLIPRPKLEEVVNGALGIRNHPMGYNPTFLYPKDGGISALGKRLSESIGPIHLNEEIEEIRTAKKVARFKSGTEISYEHLISTIPLDLCISKCSDLPESVRLETGKLDYVTVQVVNIGIDRPAVSDKHWIYYPESKFPFYRVGCPSNLSPSMAPEGTSSLSVEISALPSEAADIKKIVNETRQGLYSGSLLSPADPILFEEVRTISRAYVIPNHDYASTVPRLKQCLEEKEIYSIGRYGSWEHSSMEDGLFQGKTVSGRLLALCQK